LSANLAGACLLGAVLGYVTHYLIRRDAKPGIADLGAIIAAILGATVLKVVAGPNELSWYLIGLGAGFFLYWAALMIGKEPAIKAVGIAERRITLFPFL
jgi:hypothetical protein